jgi:hypothetical protein
VSDVGMAWIWTELLVLWIVVPVLLWRRTAKALSVIVVLLAASLYAAVIVYRERVPWGDLGFRGLEGFTASLLDGAPWVGAAVPALAILVVALHGPAALGQWPVAGAGQMARLLVFYAVVSVSSQEFLFSSFFFWRYRALFSTGGLVDLNIIIFGIAHIVYRSWISVLLTLASRVILAEVYRQHQSFCGVWTLHALFGLAAFVIGLGRYFYRMPTSPP